MTSDFGFRTSEFPSHPAHRHVHRRPNDIAFERGQFRVRGDVVEVCPAYTEDAFRIEFFGDEIERLTRFEPLTGHKLADLPDVTIFPGKQFVTPAQKMKLALLGLGE